MAADWAAAPSAVSGVRSDVVLGEARGLPDHDSQSVLLMLRLARCLTAHREVCPPGSIAGAFGGPSPVMPLGPEDIEVPQLWGDSNGGVLPSDLVRKARVEELVWLHTMKVYEKVVDIGRLWAETGKPPITLHWVGTIKGSSASQFIRSRLRGSRVEGQEAGGHHGRGVLGDAFSRSTQDFIVFALFDIAQRAGREAQAGFLRHFEGTLLRQGEKAHVHPPPGRRARRGQVRLLAPQDVRDSRRAQCVATPSTWRPTDSGEARPAGYVLLGEARMHPRIGPYLQSVPATQASPTWTSCLAIATHTSARVGLGLAASGPSASSRTGSFATSGQSAASRWGSRPTNAASIWPYRPSV